MPERPPDEEVLAGGVANAGAVTRVGDEVLRPANAYSSTIHRFLAALRATGFEGASNPVAIEPDGRERLGFIEGDVGIPPFPQWVQAGAALASIGRLMRAFHDASARLSADSIAGEWSTELADGAVAGAAAHRVIVCHNDVCLENVVFRDGVAVGLLDFDFAAPGRAVYDLAQMARMCVPIDDGFNSDRLGWTPADRPGRLRLVADSYGLDGPGRRELLDIVAHSMARGGEFVRRRVEAGDPNFVKMWEDMGGGERFDRRRGWWEAERDSFESALA